MERRIINFMALCLVVLSSCYYDSEDKLYPATTCVTTNMSYQANIVPILQNNCFVCHSQAANLGSVTLEGYTSLMQFVNNGKLLGAIKHESGFSPMPQNAPALDACNIAKIEQWITDGAQNN